jgi:DNA-binding MarR family transcriptional regulator
MRLELIPTLHRAAHRVALGLPDAKGMPSQGEAHLLVHLLESGPCTVGALHAALGHKRSTLTAILDRMEACEWVARRVQAEDRRTFLVSLTPAGREAAARASMSLAGLEARLKSRVPARDWAAALRVLRMMGEEA